MAGWAGRAAMRLLLIAFITGLALPAFAARQGLPRPLYQKLERAQRLLAAEKPAKALSLIEQARKQAHGNYANAVVLQNLGYAQLQLDRLSAATQSFQAALALEALPAETQQSLRYQLAQLLAAKGRSNQAIQLLESYLADARRPPLRAKILLGQLYAQAERWRKLPPLLKDVANRLSRRSDQERVLRLLVTAYRALGQQRRALRPLQTLVGWFPGKRDYWLRLAEAHLSLGQEADALSVLATAHLHGVLSRAGDIVLLASLYLRQGIPYQAASLLEQALAAEQLPASPANLKLTAQAWQMARDQQDAVAALRRSLAAQERLDLPLARQLLDTLLNAGQWQQAASLLRDMLAQQTVAEQPELALLLGVSEYRAGQLEQARAAFLGVAEKVGETDGSGKQARQWLDYLDYVSSGSELVMHSPVGTPGDFTSEK